MTEPLDLYDQAGAADRPRYGRTGPLRVRVPAKVNLHLGVGPLRADGFHELVTVYHAIGLYDEITVRRASTMVLTMDGEGAATLPVDEDNLVVRAVRALAARTGTPPSVRLHLAKQIPIAAGLAGGSADAAATLVACDALWGTGLSRDELAEVAAELGSDVPFLIYGGTALGTGRGERISPVLAGTRSWHWVVAAADGGLSTPEVYRELDRLRAAAQPTVHLGRNDGDLESPHDLLTALRQRDPEVLAAALRNDLQSAAVSLRPQLAATIEAGVAAGAVAGFVSGSGPTCVFLAADAASAQVVARLLADSGVCRFARPTTGPVPGARVI